MKRILLYITSSGILVSAGAESESIQLNFAAGSTVVSAATRQSLELVTYRGTPMLPIRFLQENMHVNVQTDPFWGIFEIDGLHFRVNTPEMHIYQAKVGGNVIERYCLPVSPIIQNDRIYIPMEIVLQSLGISFTKTAKNIFTLLLARKSPKLPDNVK